MKKLLYIALFAAAMFFSTIAIAGDVIIEKYPRYISTDGTPFAVYVKFHGEPNTNYYVKGYFYTSGSRNTFGYTWNYSSWVKDSEQYDKQLIILTNSLGEWSGWSYLKTNSDDTGYNGSGEYNFRIRFRKINTSSNDDGTVTIIINNASSIGWVSGYLFDSENQPMENKIIMLKNSTEIVGIYSTEDNNVDDSYSGPGFFKLSAPTGLFSLYAYELNGTEIAHISDIAVNANQITFVNLTQTNETIHNVTISSLIYPDFLIEGDTALINLSIINNGNENENISVKLYCNDMTNEISSINTTIDAGLGKTINFSWSVNAGNHSFIVFVYYWNQSLNMTFNISVFNKQSIQNQTIDQQNQTINQSEPTAIIEIPEKIYRNETFSINITLSGYEDGIYDVKADIIQNGTRISYIWNRTKFISSFYYINDAIEIENGYCSYVLKLLTINSGNATIYFKIRNSNGDVIDIGARNITILERERNQTAISQSNKTTIQKLLNPNQSTTETFQNTTINQTDNNTEQENVITGLAAGQGNQSGNEFFSKTENIVITAIIIVLVIIAMAVYKMKKPKTEFIYRYQR